MDGPAMRGRLFLGVTLGRYLPSNGCHSIPSVKLREHE